jgi:hypothetical protein
MTAITDSQAQNAACSDGEETHVRRNTLESKVKKVAAVPPKHLRPFNTKEIKILLLENVNAQALGMLKKEGYQVEFHTKALPEALLMEKIKDAHAIGIR